MHSRAVDQATVQGDSDVDVRRVVVATDRAAGGDRAVRWAERLAVQHQAELIVVLVAPSAIDEERRQNLLDLLTGEVESMRGRVSARVAIGDDIAMAIVDAAETERADVLVVGNAGMQGRTEFLLSNVANRVTHRSRCTTIVVQSNELAPADSVDEADDQPNFRRTARAVEIGRIFVRNRIHEILRDPGEGETARRNAVRLRQTLEQLGPTFCKLGQVMSTRPDLLRAEYIDELSHLRSAVPPLIEADVVTAMERELGVPWDDAFAEIDPQPLAAGTIGQVHRARLVDGTRVVVKVQRPSAAAVIERDLEVLASLARMAARSKRLRSVIDVVGMVDQLAMSLRAELDFRREATNLERMATVVARYRMIGVPRCHRQMSTARLLVMDEVVGVPVDEAPFSDERTAAARELLASFFHQVLGAGFFHADPHPGNLMWADDRLWLIDLGMVGELDASTRHQLMMLLLAFWQGDGAFLADLLLNLGQSSSTRFANGPVDVEGLGGALSDLATAVKGASLADLEVGPLLEQMTQIALRYHVELPVGLALVAKAMSQVQLTVTDLAPDQDLFAEARRLYLRETMARATERVDPATWMYEFEKLRRGLDTIIEAGAVAIGARPGQRLQIGFSSEQIERSVTRAGRAVSLGFSGGMAILGAAIAVTSHRTPKWASAALGAFGAALAASAVGDATLAMRRSDRSKQS